MYFSRRSSPLPPAGRLAHGVPHRAIARASEVSYSLNWLASGASEISLT